VHFPINRDRLCWLTVEQQFIPVFAIIFRERQPLAARLKMENI